MNAQALLEQAALRIKRAGKVAVGHLAVDRHGRPCEPHHRRAVLHDAQGALYNSCGVPPDKTDSRQHLCSALAHIDAAANMIYRQTIVSVNDELGFDAVLQCYRVAWMWAGEKDNDGED